MESKNLCPSTIATIFACKSIVNSFAENIYELAHIRKEWTVDYANSLKKEAQQIVDKIAASGNIKITLDKLKIWRELMISSLTDIGIVRASVKNDFKNDKPFQKEFYRRWNNTYGIRKPGRKQAWRYRKDILEVQKLSDALAYLIDQEIGTPEALQDRLEALEQEQTKLAEKLADGSWFVTDADAATKASQRLAEIDEELLEKLQRWDELENLANGN